MYCLLAIFIDYASRFLPFEGSSIACTTDAEKMVSIKQDQIEEGLELADVVHLSGLEIPVYNSVEVVPVASELYPVASADTEIETPTIFSTSNTNLETESQKSQSSSLQESALIRRKRRLWIFAAAILLSVICITVGVLVARALQGKSGNNNPDRYNLLPSVPTFMNIC